MNKVEVKIVIGSNYGDEGKGLATHYFSQKAKENNKKCLNVLFNGGCQRGHTVELKDGTRHIFHHFGSGTYDNAHTYFESNFMVNPIFFVKEYLELYNSEKIRPICFISPDCRVSTPYDMLINQIIEKNRKGNKHGSCGFGIFETRERYTNSEYNLTFSQMSQLTDKKLSSYLYKISKIYLPKRLKEYGINSISDEINAIINSQKMIDNYISDFRAMSYVVKQRYFNDVVEKYNTIIFEGAQGLELDEENLKGAPHLTPSKTTSQLPLKTMQSLNINKDIEICYVTRSYFTRHGAGSFPTECDKSIINSSIEDITNVNNEYQDSIRYGLFDKNEFEDRVCADMQKSEQIYANFKSSVFVTHLNYTHDNLMGNCKLDDIEKLFDITYLSGLKYAEDVKLEDN